MSTISTTMQNRRTAIGMTYSTLAKLLDTNETQARRWCTVTTPPAEQLEAIARALNFSVSELLGLTPIGLDLSGGWKAVWETTRDGVPTLNRHELTATHSGEWVYLDADGDYDWRADFRLTGSSLTGTYRAVDSGRNEHGVMSLTLNHHGGSAAIGHWSGAWADGINGVGRGVIARDADRADRLMKLLMDRDTLMITEWPTEDSQ